MLAPLRLLLHYEVTCGSILYKYSGQRSGQLAELTHGETL